MKTLTTEQVFKHMADNVRAGKKPECGLMVSLDGIYWSDAHPDERIDDIVSDNVKFRLTPRTHTINGYDVPAPETEAPEAGGEYWVIDATEGDSVYRYEWEHEDLADHIALRNGLWLSKEDAIANAKALRGEDPYREAE